MVGFEIGNEPDLYGTWFTSADYVHAFDAYARRLARIAPHTPLIGPAVARTRTDTNWISTLLTHRYSRLGIVSGHLYPYSGGCSAQGSPRRATIVKLLSDRATARLAGAVADAVRLAHRAGLPFRLTELNSVSCGGVPGVSDTFATALWAPNALFELVRAGVNGVSVHVRAGTLNAAFKLTAHGLSARPLPYGLALFARALGPSARLLRVQTRGPRSLGLEVWAVRVAGGSLHVLLIDPGSRPVTVELRSRAGRCATVQRLLAPSARARAGTTLDGQKLGNDGSWQGRATDERLRRGPHGYRLYLPRESAALIGMPAACRSGD